MRLFRNDGITLGKTVEKRFIDWLNKNKIPYLFIQQNKKTRSIILKTKFKTKKPDFFILIPYVGFIMIDTKYKRINEKFNSFPMDYKEIKEYEYFQRYFNILIWYVLLVCQNSKEEWFWVPLSKILNKQSLLKYKKFRSKKSGMSFVSIQKKEFTQVRSKRDISNLFF